jgi:hypothetical protein
LRAPSLFDSEGATVGRLGVRLAFRRPRRLLLNVCSVAVTASGIMAVLVVPATNAVNSSFSPNDPQNLRLDQATAVLSVMLVVLAAVDALFIAWATILDTRHSAALAQVLGKARPPNR